MATKQLTYSDLPIHCVIRPLISSKKRDLETDDKSEVKTKKNRVEYVSPIEVLTGMFEDDSSFSKTVKHDEDEETTEEHEVIAAETVEENEDDKNDNEDTNGLSIPSTGYRQIHQDTKLQLEAVLRYLQWESSIEPYTEESTGKTYQGTDALHIFK